MPTRFSDYAGQIQRIPFDHTRKTAFEDLLKLSKAAVSAGQSELQEMDFLKIDWLRQIKNKEVETQRTRNRASKMVGRLRNKLEESDDGRTRAEEAFANLHEEYTRALEETERVRDAYKPLDDAHTVVKNEMLLAAAIMTFYKDLCEVSKMQNVTVAQLEPSVDVGGGNKAVRTFVNTCLRNLTDAVDDIDVSALKGGTMWNEYEHIGKTFKILKPY